MKRWFMLKVVLGGAITLVSCFAIALIYVCRMHGDLLERGGFVQGGKVQIGPNVFLYRTSGRDVMLADEEGWGLLDGNIQRYAVIGEAIYLSYVKHGQKDLSFCCYETRTRTFRVLTADEIEQQGVSSKWRLVP